MFILVGYDGGFVRERTVCGAVRLPSVSSLTPRRTKIHSKKVSSFTQRISGITGIFTHVAWGALVPVALDVKRGKKRGRHCLIRIGRVAKASVSDIQILLLNGTG
jgi:hypothetical protein